MLVLSRRKDETIMIGDHVEITIVDIKGDTVRLGIAAPKSVAVHRKEIYEAIQAENIAAARPEAASGVSGIGGVAALLKPGAASPSASTASVSLSGPTAAGLSALGALLSGRVAATPVAPPTAAAAADADTSKEGH